jgi:hypothetical protein
MPNAWQRHPRYLILVVLLICCSFYLFYPSQQHPPFKPVYIFQENTLSNRLARADRIYDKTLTSRHDMVKKFGPSPKDITL